MTSSTHAILSRRSLLAGMGAGAGAAGLVGAPVAHAALLPEPGTAEEFDVVVVGAGLAGCAAALEAASTGARVIVLDKAPQNRMGGHSILAIGTFTLPEDDTEQARTAYVEDFEQFCQGRGNSEIFALQAANVRADIAWLESHGIEFLPQQPRLPTRVWNRVAGPAPNAGMPRLFRAMRSLITGAGGTFAFDTKARQLILDESGAVVGVRAVGRNGVVDYRARSVILATGGYAANTQLLEAYSDPNAGALRVSGNPWATGDGLVMAQAAGAGLKGMGGIMALHIAGVDPVETAAGMPAWTVPYAVSINREGRRFVDESLGYVFHGKAILNQPQQTTTLVFDDAIRQIDRVASNVSTYEALGLTVYSADTLEELAQLVDAPVEQFVRTVAEFNQAVENGEAAGIDPPKATLAHRIEKPPFYAFHPVVPSIVITFGGIMIDTGTRALEPDGRVIPGLYAAGENVGGVFFHDYIGGGSLTNCLVLGRIAGRQAAA